MNDETRKQVVKFLRDNADVIEKVEGNSGRLSAVGVVCVIDGGTPKLGVPVGCHDAMLGALHRGGLDVQAVAKREEGDDVNALIKAAGLSHQHKCGEMRDGQHEAGCGRALEAFGRPPGARHPVSGELYGSPNEVWSCGDCKEKLAAAVTLKQFVTTAALAAPLAETGA